MAEISCIVHGVVVFLDNLLDRMVVVVGISSVKPKLTDTVGAGSPYFNPTVRQERGDGRNTVHDIVDGICHRIAPMPVNCGFEAGSGRVNDNRLNGQVPGQFLAACSGMFSGGGGAGAGLPRSKSSDRPASNKVRFSTMLNRTLNTACFSGFLFSVQRRIERNHSARPTSDAC